MPTPSMKLASSMFCIIHNHRAVADERLKLAQKYGYELPEEDQVTLGCPLGWTLSWLPNGYIVSGGGLYAGKKGRETDILWSTTRMDRQFS